MQTPGRVEQIAILTCELAENYPAIMQTPSRVEDSTAAHSTPGIRENAYVSSMSGSYDLKIMKINFPCYERN